MKSEESFFLNDKTKVKLRELQTLSGNKRIDDEIRDIINFVYEMQFHGNKYKMKLFLLGGDKLSDISCKWIK